MEQTNDFKRFISKKIKTIVQVGDKPFTYTGNVLEVTDQFIFLKTSHEEIYLQIDKIISIEVLNG